MNVYFSYVDDASNGKRKSGDQSNTQSTFGEGMYYMAAYIFTQYVRRWFLKDEACVY